MPTKSKAPTKVKAKVSAPKKAAVKKALSKKTPAQKVTAQKTASQKITTKKAAPSRTKTSAKPISSTKKAIGNPKKEIAKVAVKKKPLVKVAGSKKAAIAPKALKASQVIATQTKVTKIAKAKKLAKAPTPMGSVEILRDKILKALDDGKAQNIIMINLAGKTAIADYMIVASGTSSRQVIALGQRIRDCMAEKGRRINLEGTDVGDWVLVDNGDIIVHLFRPEVRAFYQLEKLWSFDFASSQHFRDL